MRRLKPKRKIIQVAITPVTDTRDGATVALCDDGTIWSARYCQDKGGVVWRPLNIDDVVYGDSDYE